MSKTEFLQDLKRELEGRIPYSVIQENLRYYDTYISEEAAKGQSEDEVIESLGGPRIIARTILDAAFDTEDRPDGYESYGGEASSEGYEDNSRRESESSMHRNIHYVDFSKWHVRLIAGLAVFLVIFLLMTVFFGIIGLASWILSYIWPVLLVFLILWMFRGPGR